METLFVEKDSVTGTVTLIARHKKIGQSGVEQGTGPCRSPLLHSSQHAFSAFSSGSAEAGADMPLNMRTTAIRTIIAIHRRGTSCFMVIMLTVCKVKVNIEMGGGCLLTV